MSRLIILFTLLITYQSISQTVSNKELLGVWVAEAVSINEDVIPTNDSDKITIIKNGFTGSKFSFSKSGLFKIEMAENAPEPFNDAMFEETFYYSLNSNIIEVGQSRKGKNIMNIGISKNNNVFYFNLVGIILKVKKIKDKVKLEKTKSKRRTTVSPSKPLKNETIKEEDIIAFKAVDVIPISLECDLKFTGDALRKCVNSSFRKHIRRKFNIELALDMDLSGKIEIKTSFIINTNGDIVNIEAEAPNKTLSNEAIRAVNLIPKMIPGKHNGKPINVSYTLPIKFQITN